MKIIKWLLLILFFSCMDMFIQTIPYRSLYFTGGSWIEFPRIDSMKMASTANDFTLQFWVSGGEISTNEAPALFSIVDSQNSIKLALLRDMGGNNSISANVNGDVSPIIDNGLDWDDSDNFNLISFLFSSSSTKDLTIYINKNKIGPLESAGGIDVGDASLIFGALANKKHDILENFWYGYVDEIRLWNTILADSTIQFQAAHPDKFGENYRYTDSNGIELDTFLDSLIGIWRFNLSELAATIKDESGYGHDGAIYTLNNNYSIELSEKGIQ